MRGAIGLVCGLLGFVLGGVLMPSYAQNGNSEQTEQVIIQPGQAVVILCEAIVSIPSATGTTKTQTPTSTPTPTGKPTLPPTLTPRPTNTPATTPTLSGIFQTATQLNSMWKTQTAQPRVSVTRTTVPMVQSPAPTRTNTPTPKPYIVPPSPTQEDPSGDSGPVIYVVNYQTGMNVRKETNTGAEILGTLPKGARVGVYEEKVDAGHRWGKIQFGGREGWVALSQLNGYQFLVKE